ncbi:MAG: Crp/Fnr family transcriptional regulator [Planctomycetes bacterium]|nr:Crp/Fnr family transcriptional regulator [Planctomycetota bacterium]
MAHPQLTEAIASIPHFHSLPPDLVEKLAEGSRIVRLAPHEVLFTQGEPVRGFYMVLSGAVQLYRSTPDGRDQVLNSMKSGQTFAEAAALTMLRTPASARTLDESAVLIEVGASSLAALMHSDPRVASSVVVSLSLWLHTLMERVEELQIDSAPARLARYLLRLPGRSDGERTVLELPMPKKDLAAHLALAPETLSRLLRRWQNEGVIESNGRELVVIDARALEAIADRDELRARKAREAAQDD